MKSLVSFGNSFNVTADYWPVAMWSKLELTAGIVCACMPAARQLCCKLVPRICGRAVAETRNTASTPAETGRKGSVAPLVIASRSTSRLSELEADAAIDLTDMLKTEPKALKTPRDSVVDP
jgi:hypothetical protein